MNEKMQIDNNSEETLVKKKETWADFFKQSIILIAAVAIIRLFIFDNYNVNGQSMYPTLDGTGERVFVNKIVYKVSKPKYGDIIIVKPFAEESSWIKRIIGLPGDKIRVTQGIAYRNDKPLAEKYTLEPAYKDVQEVVIPEGAVYFMGDNRNNSTDSRVIGYVSQNKIIGRAEFIWWPFNSFKTL